ncbi:hypothetical protein ACLKA7_005466 [Drosophila subpalustris]
MSNLVPNNGHLREVLIFPIHSKKTTAGVIYYELLKPSETTTGDRYRLQLMRLSRALREKRPQSAERHEKVASRCQTSKNLLGNAEMGNLNPPAIFARYCADRLSPVSIDGTWTS